MLQPQFWHIDSPDSTANRASHVDHEIKWAERIICPVNDGHQRGGKRLSDLSVSLPPRAARDDFVWAWGGNCLLQDSAFDLFKSSGFTGFEVRPVKAKCERPSFDDFMAAVRVVGMLPMERFLADDDSFKIELAGGREVEIPSSIGMAIRGMAIGVRMQFEGALEKARSAKVAEQAFVDFTGLAEDSRRVVSQIAAIAASREPPALHELVVTGWGGIAPPESGVKLIEKCDACGLLYFSAWTNPETLIDSSRWDGSDFFRVWPAASFVTRRVADAIRDNRLSGAVLTPPAELPPCGSRTLSGNRLSLWMPADRAHELGAALGIE